MALTKAEKQSNYRKRKKEAGVYENYKAQHRENMANYRVREAAKENELSPREIRRRREERREGNRDRTRLSRERARERAAAEEALRVRGPFGSAIAEAKAYHRAKRALNDNLPKSPRRRSTVQKKLAMVLTSESGADIAENQPEKSPSQACLSAETKQRVKDFYHREDVSRQSPNVRDRVIIRTVDANGKSVKTYMPGRTLYDSVSEVYSRFTEIFPDDKIGKSKFAELRPEYILPSSKTPNVSCCCQKHEDFMMALDALRAFIPDFPKYTKDLPSNFMCKQKSHACWTNSCKNCSGGKKFQDYMKKYKNETESTKTTKCLKWDQDENGRLRKVESEETYASLLLYIKLLLPGFLNHHVTKRHQSDVYQSQLQTVKKRTDLALIQVDFAQNYTCFSQDEVQSAHWNQSQVSLFTAGVWNGSAEFPTVFASDNLEHSKSTIIPYMYKLFRVLPSTVKTVHIWTDGPTSQFKNRYMAHFIPALEKAYGVKIVWHYFATSHGKGPCDGLGAAAKTMVRTQVKSRVKVVHSAMEFVTACEKSKMNVLCMSNLDIENNAEEINLNDIIAKAEDASVAGIMKAHCIEWRDGDMVMKELSDPMEEMVASRPPSASIAKDQPFNTGSWVDVVYEEEVYRGIVLESKRGFLRVQCLVKCAARSGASSSAATYRLEEEREAVWYAADQVLGSRPVPTMISSRGLYKMV